MMLLVLMGIRAVQDRSSYEKNKKAKDIGLCRAIAFQSHGGPRNSSLAIVGAALVAAQTRTAYPQLCG